MYWLIPFEGLMASVCRSGYLRGLRGIQKLNLLEVFEKVLWIRVSKGIKGNPEANLSELDYIRDRDRVMTGNQQDFFEGINQS